ncbi:MAG: HNH endonuclease [Solirubrobacteraceae bacterium]
MRRAVAEILDPSPRNVDALWAHFESSCAYCGKPLSREKREGHRDHAAPGGGNGLGNLVLACGSCNGDEKREASWHEFLKQKTTDLAPQRSTSSYRSVVRQPCPEDPGSRSASRGTLCGVGAADRAVRRQVCRTQATRQECQWILNHPDPTLG